MDTCPRCNKQYKNNESIFCSYCGTPRKSKISDDHANHCTRPGCANYDVKLATGEQFCNLCGSPTIEGKSNSFLTGRPY